MGVWKIDKKDSQIIKEAIGKAFMEYEFSILDIGRVIQIGNEKYKTYKAQKKFIMKILSQPKNTDAPTCEDGEIK